VSHGIVAAALAYLLSCCVLLPVEIALVIRAYGLRTSSYLRALAPIAVATGVMAGVTELAAIALEPLPPLPALLGAVVVGALSFTVSLRVLARTVFARTVDELRQIVRRKRSA